MKAMLLGEPDRTVNLVRNGWSHLGTPVRLPLGAHNLELGAAAVGRESGGLCRAVDGCGLTREQHNLMLNDLIRAQTLSELLPGAHVRNAHLHDSFQAASHGAC